jgi:hypothetical protein
MAQPKTIKGSKVLILLGDGTTPTEVFAAPCGLTTKGITFTAESNDQNVPDCDDPDAPTFTARVIATLSAAINGAGILALESLEDWREWFDSGLEKNIRLKLDAAAPEGGYYQMSAVLTSFAIGGNQGELATVDVGILSNGAWAWTPAV